MNPTPDRAALAAKPWGSLTVAQARDVLNYEREQVIAEHAANRDKLKDTRRLTGKDVV